MSVGMAAGESPPPRLSTRASSAGLERKKSVGGTMLDKVGNFFGGGGGSSKNLVKKASTVTAEAIEEPGESGVIVPGSAAALVSEEVSELKQEKAFTRGKSFTGKGSTKMDALVA